MKTILATLTLAAVTTTALGQGRINFIADSLHLVYFNPDVSELRPGDASLAGQPVPAGGVIPSGTILVADLYSGSSSSTLALTASRYFTNSALAGQWSPIAVTLPAGQAGGTTNFFQVTIHDVNPLDLVYISATPIFTAVPSISSFVPLFQQSAPVFSTLLIGTFPLDQVALGDKGYFLLGVPEPSTATLATLGAAAFLFCRRRGRRTTS